MPELALSRAHLHAAACNGISAWSLNSVRVSETTHTLWSVANPVSIEGDPDPQSSQHAFLEDFRQIYIGFNPPMLKIYWFQLCQMIPPWPANIYCPDLWLSDWFHLADFSLILGELVYDVVMKAATASSRGPAFMLSTISSPQFVMRWASRLLQPLRRCSSLTRIAQSGHGDQRGCVSVSVATGYLDW